MINGAQIRAARALLGWSMADLTLYSSVSSSTIKRLEAAELNSPSATVASIDAIEKAFRSFGIVFIPENGGGAGVRFAKPAGNGEGA